MTKEPQNEVPTRDELGGNFERYLAGVPLNEELAELRSGQQAATTQALEVRAIQKGQRRRLTRQEKAALRDLRAGEAWPALTALAKIAVQRREEAATMLSQEDPLGRGQEVAAQWAYVKMFKELWLELVIAVESAAATVESEEVQ